MSFISNAVGSIFRGATNDYTPMGNGQFNTDLGTASGNYNQANTGLNQLIQQLQQQSQGGGPNLAGQQLANATAQNVNQQGALMAGQRGASSNVGLMSRQIAQNGAGIQQQAAGQSAENVLKQQLMAQGQLGQALQSQGQLAGGMYGNAASALTGNSRTGAQIAQNNAGVTQGFISGLGNAMGSLMGMAGGGLIDFGKPQAVIDPGLADNSGSDFGKNFMSFGKPKNPMAGATNVASGSGGVGDMGGGLGSFLDSAGPAGAVAMAAKGGMMHAPFSPTNMESGGNVRAQAPSQKAVAPGNNYSNDKVPAMLSEGEVVLPRSVTQSPDPVKSAANFMAQVLAGKHRKGK